MDTLPDTSPLYRRLAEHYRRAIQTGALTPGTRLPSVRALTRLHQVSLSTTLQACRHLEDEGWLEARPRSGYFVRQPRRALIQPASEPDVRRTLQPVDPTSYRGIHDRASDYVAKCELHSDALNLASLLAVPAAYPVEALKNSTLRALRRRPELLATNPPPQGEPALRQALARRALDAGIDARNGAAAQDIIVTHGCTEAINIALRAVTQAGDLVAVESPTYFGLLQTLESLGLRTLEIPTSPQTGISVEALQFALQTHPTTKAVVVMPNFHNPLGCSMPETAKQSLVALCEQHNMALIEDDCYSVLADDDTQPRALKAYDRNGGVIYCASLQKALAPGSRLGWMIGGRWHARIKMLKHAQSRPTGSLLQLSLAEFIDSRAYERHLMRLRRALRTQRMQLAEAVAAYFPAGTRLSMPSGGIQLWVELPPAVSAHAVFDAALQHGIRVAPGWMFTNSERFNHFLRISCGHPYSKHVDQALRTLGTLVADNEHRKRHA